MGQGVSPRGHRGRVAVGGIGVRSEKFECDGRNVAVRDFLIILIHLCEITVYIGQTLNASIARTERRIGAWEFHDDYRHSLSSRGRADDRSMNGTLCFGELGGCWMMNVITPGVGINIGFDVHDGPDRN